MAVIATKRGGEVRDWIKGNLGDEVKCKINLTPFSLALLSEGGKPRNGLPAIKGHEDPGNCGEKKDVRPSWLRAGGF